MKGAERGAACGQRRFHPDPLKEMGIPAPFFKRSNKRMGYEETKSSKISR
jgi:hypothetical protein